MSIDNENDAEVDVRRAGHAAVRAFAQRLQHALLQELGHSVPAAEVSPGDRSVDLWVHVNQPIRVSLEPRLRSGLVDVVQRVLASLGIAVSPSVRYPHGDPPRRITVVARPIESADGEGATVRWQCRVDHGYQSLSGDDLYERRVAHRKAMALERAQRARGATRVDPKAIAQATSIEELADLGVDWNQVD